jgi:hypothetical protein
VWQVEEEEAGLIGVLLRTGVEAVAVDVDVAVAVEEEGGWRVRLVLGGVDMLRTWWVEEEEKQYVM